MLCDLKNEDCLKYLSTIKDNSMDMILTDPPYEISRETNFSSGKPKGTDVDRFRVSMDFGEWDSENKVELASVCSEFHRVLKKGGYLVIFYDLWKITELKNILENVGFKQLRFIEWVKTNPVPLNSRTNYLTNAREIAVTAVKGSSPKFHSVYDNGIYSYPIAHGKDRFHPTQKPVDLMVDLIMKHTDENDTVLDCFFGSGTTAIACLKSNRNFFGCELNKEYYEKSKERIRRWIFK